MDLTTVIGLAVCFILVIGGVVAGGQGLAFIDFQSMLIVLGGTSGALIVSNPPEKIKGFMKVLKMAFTGGSPDLVSLVQTIVSFAEKARREGLLALEADASELDNEFLKKSIQLVVDGTDPELVKAILDTEIGILESRHSSNKYFFDSMASTAYLSAEDWEQALAYADRSLVRNDRHVSSLRVKICALHHLGRGQEARDAAADLKRRQPGFSVAQYRRTHPAADARVGRNVVSALLQAGLT